MTPEKILAAQKKLGLTQLEMAALLECGLSTYKDWIVGKSHPPGCLGAALKWHLSQASALQRKSK